MIVGIDIDDTMTNHCESWFNAYNKYFKALDAQDLKVEDATNWDFYNDWKESDKEQLMKAIHTDSYYDNLYILPNVKETIQAILDSDNQVVIISATYPESQDRKRDWLLSQLPMLSPDDIIFTKYKERIAVDVMIDDNLAYASKFKCQFILFKRPWNTNQDYKLYTPNIIIADSWEYIKEVLTSMGIISSKIATEPSLTKATKDLINGIKNAQTDEECLKLINPYIRLWQQQGMLIGMRQINDAIITVTNSVIDDIKNNENVKK